MREEDWHYIGGIMDGEGCFNLVVAENDDYSNGYQAYPSVSIGMTVEDETSPVMELSEEVFSDYNPGISIGVRTRERYDTDVWSLSLSGSKSLEFMKDVLPYLREKRSKVEKILTIEWDRIRKDREEFMYMMEVRQDIRNNNTDVKCDYETVKESLEVQTGCVSEVSW